MNIINSFKGQYKFLSNFYSEPGHKALEYEYQASKFLDTDKKQAILDCATPDDAKRLARKMWADQREDWERVSIQTMLDLLRKKFAPGSSLARRLLDTGDAYLEEGNTWNDTFYGTVAGKGSNVLGLLLMIVRAELKTTRELVNQAVAKGFVSMSEGEGF